MFCRGNRQYCNPTMVRKQCFKMNILGTQIGYPGTYISRFVTNINYGALPKKFSLGENESKRTARLISGIDQQPLQQID